MTTSELFKWLMSDTKIWLSHGLKRNDLNYYRRLKSLPTEKTMHKQLTAAGFRIIKPKEVKEAEWF